MLTRASTCQGVRVCLRACMSVCRRTHYVHAHLHSRVSVRVHWAWIHVYASAPRACVHIRDAHVPACARSYASSRARACEC